MPQKGRGHPKWRGGRYIDRLGYGLILLQPDDPFFPMAHYDGYVLEHRLIVAKSLGRCLLKQEQVHHKNGIRDDNRLENLDLMPSLSKHTSFMACTNCSLRKEIRLLRWQIKEQSEQIKNLTAHLMGI